jgi:hypothetical protein
MITSLRLSEDAVRGVYPAESINAGLPIVPLGRTKSGRLIWPVLGGAPKDGDTDDEDDSDEDEDQDDDDSDDEDDDDEDSGDDEEDGPEGKKSKKKQPEGDPQRKIAALEDEKNRLYRGRQRARQERDDLQKQIDTLKAEGSGDETLKKQVSELESSVKTMSSSLQESRLKIAFLSNNTYEWQNPGLALRAADLSEVEIDDDGKVHGLVAALEALAKEHPYLLKQKVTRRKPEPSTTSTGSQPKRTPKGAAKAREDEIRRKYNIHR